MSNYEVLTRDEFNFLKRHIPDVRAYRCSSDGQRFWIPKDPTKLGTDEDKCAINSDCDGIERAKNKEIKSIFLGAIRQYFNQRSHGQNLQIIEFGSGRHPLTDDNIRKSGHADYHAIEIDQDIITELKARDISISTIDTIEEGVLQIDRTRIAAGVYTLHQWEPHQPADVKRVLSQDGFFVANYMSPRLKNDPDRAKNLIAAFTEEGLTVSIVRPEEIKSWKKGQTSYNPAFKMANEFWVASYPPERNGMKSEATRFADLLRHQLSNIHQGGIWAKPRTYDAV